MIKMYEKGKIAPINLFILLFVSRTIIGLTYIQSVINTKMTSDLIFSILISLFLTILIMLPIFFCVKQNKNLLDNKFMSVFYSFYFIFAAMVNIMRFSYFASGVLNLETPPVIFSVIIILCIVYGASREIEAISRWGSIVCVILLFSITVILSVNISEFSFNNFLPFFKENRVNILKDAFILSCNASEIPLYLFLSKKVNGKTEKPFFYSVIFAVLTIFIVYFTAIGTLGDYAYHQPFPIYSLSEITKVSQSSRLDVLFISAWIFCIFLKASLYLYSSYDCLKNSFEKLNKKQAVAVSSLTLLALTVFVSVLYESVFSSVSKLVVCLLFLTASVVLPTVYFVLNRKKGANKIEKN